MRALLVSSVALLAAASPASASVLTGQTSQGRSVRVQTAADGLRVVDVRAGYRERCADGTIVRAELHLGARDAVAIRSDGTFRISERGDYTDQRRGAAHYAIGIRGTFAGGDFVRGTIRTVGAFADGVVCRSGTISFTARRGG